MDATPRSSGLGARLRGLGVTAFALLQTRLELLATEVQEEGVRLGGLLAWAATAFFFIGFGAVFLALYLTVLLWDSHRLLALGVFTSLFIFIGIVAAVIVVRLSRRGSRLFGASIAELTQDSKAMCDEK